MNVLVAIAWIVVLNLAFAVALVAADFWRDERDRRVAEIRRVAEAIDRQGVGMRLDSIERDWRRLPVGARFVPTSESEYEPGSYATVDLR